MLILFLRAEKKYLSSAKYTVLQKNWMYQNRLFVLLLNMVLALLKHCFSLINSQGHVWGNFCHPGDYPRTCRSEDIGLGRHRVELLFRNSSQKSRSTRCLPRPISSDLQVLGQFPGWQKLPQTQSQLIIKEKQCFSNANTIFKSRTNSLFFVHLVLLQYCILSSA